MLFFIIPVALCVFLLPSLSARYLIPALPGMISLVVFLLKQMSHRVRFFLIFILVLAQGLLTGACIFAPQWAYKSLWLLPAAQSDFAQFVTGWTSGYGVSETVSYIRREANSTPVIVLVRFDSGNPEDAIRLLLSDNERILVKTLLPNSPILPQLRWYATAKVPVFFVSRGSQLMGMDAYFVQRSRFAKPFDGEYVGIYQLIMP
jgi:hypothetical protein